MKWRGRRKSSKIDDRRGRSASRRVAIGGGGGMLLLVVLAIGIFSGADPLQLFQQLEQVQSQLPPSTPGPTPPGTAQGDEVSEFLSVVLADTEDTWIALMQQMGMRYELPDLVIFDDAVQSACGYNSAAVGPFYCPADRKIYLDTGFFDELERRFGAPGDFAQAYVVAHEVAHHVQNLLGISGEVQRMRTRASQSEANQLSVRLELQADCLAGVWGHHANRRSRMLEPGDIEEGLAAAAAIGDDAIQRQSSGHVRPESWTHGSSEQRVSWFRRGLDSGDPDVCDTL